MRDVTHDPDAESQYECFQCGTIITAVATPDRCPDCGGELRHRRTPIE